jgi:hypothetical protein
MALLANAPERYFYKIKYFILYKRFYSFSRVTERWYSVIFIFYGVSFSTKKRKEKKNENKDTFVQYNTVLYIVPVFLYPTSFYKWAQANRTVNTCFCLSCQDFTSSTPLCRHVCYRHSLFCVYYSWLFISTNGNIEIDSMVCTVRYVLTHFQFYFFVSFLKSYHKFAYFFSSKRYFVEVCGRIAWKV